MAALLLAALLAVFALQPETASAWGQTGEIACGVLAGLGTCRWLMHASPARIRTCIRIAVALVVASFLGGLAERFAAMALAGPMPDLDAWARGGWLRRFLDLACTVSLAALFGALAARSMQARRQP